MSFTDAVVHSAPMPGQARRTYQQFFAQSVHIKLALPQAAPPSLFYKKISSVAPPQGALIEDALLRG